jgi:hypothetical protein
MNNPSLTDFMPKAPASKAEKPESKVKNLTIRPSFPQWEALIELTTRERTKIQAYTIGLYRADFERRGLRWPE